METDKPQEFSKPPKQATVPLSLPNPGMANNVIDYI